MFKMFLFTHLENSRYRWGNTPTITINSFRISNVVRQGGPLSPMIFNIYMNARSIKPSSSGIWSGTSG